MIEILDDTMTVKGRGEPGRPALPSRQSGHPS
jgi:hypothetical protein